MTPFPGLHELYAFYGVLLTVGSLTGAAQLLFVEIPRRLRSEQDDA